MKPNFILIDFENVHPGSLAMLRGKNFKTLIFLGATQTKLPTELACEIQALGPNAEYVRSDGSGHNALDFHIAYYIGRLSAEHPEATFHIISKDTGFDPLIKHLRTKGIICQRSANLSGLPGMQSAASTPPASRARAVAQTADPLRKVIENLAKRGTARPRTIKRLASSIKDLLGAQTSDEAVDKMVAELAGRGVLKVSEGRVTYPNA